MKPECQTVLACDARYPRALFELEAPPPVLYVRGDPDLLSRGRGRHLVAVVGARRATEYGLRIARDVGAALADAGFVVVSGLAMGVDAAAHLGALEVGGDTVAVLGSGVNRPTPLRNQALARRIASKGALVSEFEPDEGARPHHFPQRNRVIAALGAATIVIEAGARSGALITAEWAAHLDRPVLAVPGPVDRPQSYGSNALLRDGRIPVVSVPDLPGDLAMILHTSVESASSERAPDLPAAESRVLAALGESAASVGDVCGRTGLATAEALAALSALELRGWVQGDGPGRYRRTHPRAVLAPTANTGGSSAEPRTAPAARRPPP